MFLNVSLANDERSALLIPEEALTPEAERQFVFVVVDGKAERREVRIGGRQPGSVEIVTGLEAGEQVIVEGTQKVRDGSLVAATERAPLEPVAANEAHEASTSPASLRQ
jgi:membrane fusion protein (multidrug efflux system)